MDSQTPTNASPAAPPPPVQPAPQPEPVSKQKGPVKIRTAIIIGIVYVFVLIIFCSLAIIGINLAKNKKLAPADATVSSNPTNARVFSASPRSPDIVFRGETFRQSYHSIDTKNNTESYEFLKSEENPDSWMELITFVKYTNATGVLQEVDDYAENVKSFVVTNGGFVIDAFTKTDAASGLPQNFLIYSYKDSKKNKVEVDFEKFYLRGHQLLTDVYSINFVGNNVEEANAKALEFLKNDKAGISDSMVQTDISKDYWNN